MLLSHNVVQLQGGMLYFLAEGDFMAVNTQEKKSTISARVSPELKEQATHVANSMGMDMSTAITMFLTQMVRQNALPFKPVGSPLDEAIQEVKDGKTKSFTSVKDLMADLHNGRTD